MGDFWQTDRRNDETTTINILICVHFVIIIVPTAAALPTYRNVNQFYNAGWFGIGRSNSGSIVHVQVCSWKVRDGGTNALQAWESRIIVTAARFGAANEMILRYTQRVRRVNHNIMHEHARN